MINEKMSLAQCKKGLESDGSVYTDEQVKVIRDFLYRMAEWEYEGYLKLKQREKAFELEKQNEAKVISLQNGNPETSEAA